jgi:hypothetical protein
MRGTSKGMGDTREALRALLVAVVAHAAIFAGVNPIPQLQTVELAPGVNVSVPTVNVSVLAVHGDPADLGAKPRRVVHARLLDSKVL